MAVASSCREVSCQVRQRSRPASSVATSLVLGTLRRPPLIKWRKERATAGQYAPNSPGHTRAAMAGTMGSDLERGRQSRKPAVVGIEGCNPPS